ncbi:GxxExxY protein [Candidatus Sumerlaeota bacterium]|nr:GxxExxY protein [Candidatus Sumerlaeota bacterium]
MLYENLTEIIIGCAYKVYNTLGFGFLESVYENSILLELKRAGLDAQQQKPIQVYYDGQIVGEFVADIVVHDIIIIELKSVRKLIESHEVQLVNYLKATGKDVGLLINFGENKVEVKRKVRSLNKNPDHPVHPV